MNYIKIYTTSCSYRVVGVFCDFDVTELDYMLDDFEVRYNLPKEFLIDDAVFKISVNHEVSLSHGQEFDFNVLERIK